MSRNYHKVSMHDITTEINIGVVDWEKHPDKKQKITVDVDVYRFTGSFRGKSIKDCFDYRIPFALVTEKWPRRKHVELLETLAEELVTTCLKDKNADAARVVIRKPHTFNGRAVPAVEFYREKK